ncbi:hypothetical protein EV215_1393 [Hypnocyclicus thermotrophus]|uniref:Uncharacterized protein n=1 Tax=Hypnocyclicus thermotrophus TaxID=1627895 RepID=A0AA46DYF4_9FUSO|nr:hypothetical protein [Hypnocyclicus thermotrophus]TDT69850.1 hypothetical protein EV215_1393 [Hypnocyclicus thermotrophus]
MHYLYVKVMDIDYKEDIFLALESVDIVKASYIEGTNLDNALTRELPLFKGFFQSEEEKSKQVILINALINDEEQAQEFITMLREAGIDVDNGEIIRVLTWPVNILVG